MANWAVIGAGLAGVTLAKALAAKHHVTIFEKSHSSAGRMSTRRRSIGDQEFAFDHGAQYFTIKSPAFHQALQPYLDQGVVQPWHARMVTINKGKVTPRNPPSQAHSPSHAYVATPGMTGLVKAMASGLDIRHQVEIRQIAPQQDQWRLTDADGNSYDGFDGVVAAIPAKQAAVLMPDAKPDLDKVQMLGCFTVMLGFEDASILPQDWDAGFVEDESIGFIAINSSKPGRSPDSSSPKASMVVQANNIWADQRLDEDPKQIEAILHQDLADLIGVEAKDAVITSFHRWRYAATAKPLGQEYWRHDHGQLAAIGDWCIKGRVEAAYLSAMALAKAILEDG